MSSARGESVENRQGMHERSHSVRDGVLVACLAALAFGVTVPLVQRLGVGLGPFTTAGLLYGGAILSTVGRARRDDEAPLRRTDLPRLAACALAGSVAAPALLAWGLQHTSGAASSLLLNLEAVFTVAFGRLFFSEPIGKRLGAAVGLMVVGGVVLALRLQLEAPVLGLGALAVILATFGWALDNTVTRPLADRDPSLVVRAKATFGSMVSGSIAIALMEKTPSFGAMLGLLACGWVGYGLSLRLYLRAQRILGAARTGSVFALAPFIGALVAIVLGDRDAIGATAIASIPFALGVYLHVTEVHEHTHQHLALDHEHAHTHDDGHHTHVHDSMVIGEHSHLHHHGAGEHTHPHGSDLHHQHGHE